MIKISSNEFVVIMNVGLTDTFAKIALITWRSVESSLGTMNDFADDVRNAHRLSGGKRMVLADGNADLQIVTGDNLQTAAGLQRIADDDIDLFLQQTLGQLARIGDRDVEPHMRVFSAKSLHELPKEFACDGIVDAYSDCPGVTAMQRVDLRARGQQFIHRSLDAIEQRFAGCGQPKTLAISHEQLDAKLLLQELKLPADGGRCDVDLVGRQPKRAVSRDLVEIPQGRGINEIRKQSQRHGKT